MSQARRDTSGLKLEVNQRLVWDSISLSHENQSLHSDFKCFSLSHLFCFVFLHFPPSILGSCSDLMKVSLMHYSIAGFIILSLLAHLILDFSDPVLHLCENFSLSCTLRVSNRPYTCWSQLPQIYRRTLWKAVG